MGQMVFEPTQSWELGAHATPAQDLSPKGSFPVGENTVLFRNTGQSAVIAQREGWALLNVLPQEGSSPITGQYDFIRAVGVLTSDSQHLVVNASGRLDILLPDKTLVPADPAEPDAFTPGMYPPSFATMNNLCFIANGMDHLHVFNGTRHWGAGAEAPAAPTVVDAGTGVQPADDYSFLITYYDEATGYETSASPATVILKTANPYDQFQVTWVAPPASAHDRPFTHTRVYMCQMSNQTEHFLLSDSSSVFGQVPLPVITLNVNINQDTIDALTILAPDEFENNPPPENLIGVEAHVSRLFAHDGSRVFYSNLDAPEAWDPDNHFSVNVDDGQQITALHAAHEVLVVFKRDSVWALYGEDPATWVPRLISSSVGCLNERSIVYVEGSSYWWSEGGPMSWAGTGPVNNLAVGRLDALVALEQGISTLAAAPNPALNMPGIVGTLDVINQRLLWAVPEVNHAQNNVIFPYKYKFNQWEATKWFGMDAASLASIQDDNSTPHVYLGNYKGQIFRYGGVVNDGTPSGKLVGQVASTGTPNSITIVPGAEPGPDQYLYVDGNGLTERYLYVNNLSTGEWQIKRIGSNTETEITLAEGEEFSLIPNDLWVWSVGTIGFKVHLPWSTFASPFIKKRLEYAYFWVGSSVNASDIQVSLYRDYNDGYVVRNFILSLKAGGLVWDQGNWDEAVWGSGISTIRHRKRLAKTCFNYQWVFRQYTPNADAVILKIDTRAETQVDKT